MKRRNILFLLVIGLLIAAFFTKPGLDEFRKFIVKEIPATPPLIEEVNGVVYTMFTVSSFQIADRTTGDASSKVAVPGEKQKYLGVFGKFWKL